jgi:hypothetical protein
MPSLNYMQTETATVWTDSGGDKLLDLGALGGSGTTRMGAYLDLGANSKADWYEAELFIDGFNGAPTIGGIIELWFAQSNATTGFDGQLTTDPTDTTAGTVTDGQKFNCIPALFLKIVSTTAGDGIQGRCRVKLTSRYVAPIVINWTSGTMLSTADAHTLTLTPIPQEGQ